MTGTASRDPSPEEPSDAHLLARHVDGDPEAFAALVRRHQDRMWAVALKTLGDPEEAADALQDAMVKAFRSAAGFRGDSAVTTWLHRIVVNACIDRTRRAKVHPSVPLPEVADHVAAFAEGPPGADPVLDRQRQVDVVAALRQIPAEQRAAVVLVDMEGYSVEEAAWILDCPPGTIKSRCSRARARLAPLLGAWRNHQPPGNVQPTPGGSPRAGPAPPMTDPDQPTRGGAP